MKKVQDSYEIRANDYVTVTEMNHITEVQYLKNQTPSGSCAIRKIDADRYMVNETGEIKEFKKSENRADNTESLRQTMKRLRYLINNNFTGSRNELFLTLTYRENMQDTKRLYKDADVFMKRLKRHFKDNELRYVTVAEPQERGAWHLHILIKVKGLKNALYLDNNALAEMWGHGFTSVKRLRNDVDNLGAYLTTYFTDLEIENTEENEKNGVVKEVLENGKIVDKRVIKGARLHFYPSGFNFYRSSRNCRKPLRTKMKYIDILKRAHEKKLGEKTYERTITIVDTNFSELDDKFSEEYGGRLLNTIKLEIYNNFIRKSG